MNAALPVGWNGSDPAEWTILPGPFARWLMLRRFRKEMRAW